MCYAAEPIHYGYDLNITPSADKDNVFICKVTVRDLDSNKILWEPQIITAAGEEAMMEIGDKKDNDINIKIKILVDKEKSSAAYSIETSGSEHVISFFTGTVVFEQ
jgi:hypothetical protein